MGIPSRARSVDLTANAVTVKAANGPPLAASNAARRSAQKKSLARGPNWSYQLVVPIDASKTEPSAADACAHALRKAILSGEIPAGIRLPPERALAERFSVNRVTVRAALAQLEAEHLLSVRQGSGHTVRDFRRAGGPDLIGAIAELARGADRTAIVRDLLLVRRQLARALFEKMIGRVTEASLDAAGAAVDRFAAEAARGASPEELAASDLAIVAALVDASGSTVLALCLNPVAALVRELPGLAAAMYREPRGNAAAWRAVLSWIAAGSREQIDAVIAELASRDEATVRAFAAHSGPSFSAPRSARTPGRRR